MIFRANIANLDADYMAMAERMRRLAMDVYGCVEFTVCNEGNQEIAISYWHNEDQIKQWRQDSEHVAAQHLGKTKWYENYHVQVSKVIREHSYGQ